MRLPIFQCAIEAYGDLLAHPKTFLLLVAIILPVTLFLPEGLPFWDAERTWIDRSRVAICLLPFAVFALVWLRLRLQAPQGNGRQQRAPGEGLVTYLGAGTALLTLLWLPFISYPLTVALFLELGRMGVLQSYSGWMNGYVAAVLLIPPWCYLRIRASIVLPAVAQGKPFDLHNGWKSAAGNGGRLIAACLLATLPMLILATALPDAIYDQDLHFQTARSRIAARLVAGPLQLAAAALFMNVLASAYRRLPGSSPEQDQTLMRFE